jgi:hypothetical protein
VDGRVAAMAEPTIAGPDPRRGHPPSAGELTDGRLPRQLHPRKATDGRNWLSIWKPPAFPVEAHRNGWGWIRMDGPSSATISEIRL